MKKILPLAFLLMPALAVEAQTDTTSPKRDTLGMEMLRDAILDNTPTISLDENDMGDAGSQNISSMLTAGRDPYFSAVGFNFSAARFNIRGYDNAQFSTFMNGIPMDNLDNGFTPYGLWGGLNDVMRNRDVSFGLRYNTFGFGDIGSTTQIDSRASRQRAQTSISYASANRNYRNRVMATHSSGMNKNGWAYSVSGSHRWADEGYVPGTFYDGWSYFGAVDKRVGQDHLFSLIAFGAPTVNGRQSAATQEMMDYAGTNYYNPAWGWQDGKKRSANVGSSHQPTFILQHEWKLNPNATLTTGAGYTFGDRTITALDWYNAPDPRPDYYRYLPSYYNSASVNDPSQYFQLLGFFKNDENTRQINWDRLYNVNRLNNITVNNVNGEAGNSITGKRSLYVLENRIINTKRFTANTVLNAAIGSRVDFTGGLTFQRQVNHYYKTLNDLLGGDFYVNLNQFAEREFPGDNTTNQNDLERPNRIIKEGDPFGYDYNLITNKGIAWAQSVVRFNKIDLYIAGKVSTQNVYRFGNVKNGLFPDNSLGNDEQNHFINYGFKGGITYKLDGRNYFYVNAYRGTEAPFFENIYISPRTRNTRQSEIKSEQVFSSEAGYTLNAPNVKVHLSGYYTTFKNQMDVMTFYHDQYRNFVNYAMRGIDRMHFGGEFGTEVKITPTFSVNAAAAVGRYYYTNRPTATVTVDNRDEVLATQTIYAKNYRIPSMPQEAYNLGLSYRSPKFWFVTLNGNYFRQTWLSYNPIRRTYEATEGLEYKGTQWNEILDQEMFDPQFTLDFFGGWSYKLPSKMEIANKNTFLVFNLGISNLLNNTHMRTGGFEQLRFDATTRDINKFPPKYYYAYGANYYASVTLRF